MQTALKTPETTSAASETIYRFSFGPWNISEGADPFGPDVRQPIPLERKLPLYRDLGFEGIQLHDDDVVEGLEGLSHTEVIKRSAQVGQQIRDAGLTPEFVAPRLWFSPETVDGGLTSNSAADRASAMDRCKQAVDIGRETGTTNIVMWLAREGTYAREAKDPVTAYQRLLEGLNALLDYDREIEIWIEPKPNEPTDQAYVPTIGHVVALAYASSAPSRVKGLIESAHAMLAGLDPGDEMGFALAHGKLASVHLNDQNGLKYDQDKNFGAANLRGAFNQVRVLEDNGYGQKGEFIGLDVKAMRTQMGEPVTAHLKNSRETFLALVDKVRTLDRKNEQQFIEARDYEGLERYILRHLMGLR